MINHLLNGVLGGAWNLAKNTYHGARGTRVVKDAVTGLETTVRGRDALIKSLKENAGRVAHGGRKGKDGVLNTGDWFERQAERIGGVFGIASDMTFGAAGQMLGWGLGGIGRAIVSPGSRNIGAKLGKASIRGVGHVTNQSMRLFGDTAINGAGFVMDLAKSPYGAAALMAAPVAIAGGVSAFKEETGQRAIQEAIQMSVGQELESMPGLVTPSRRTIENFGADGDLVFAMHNLR